MNAVEALGAFSTATIYLYWNVQDFNYKLNYTVDNNNGKWNGYDTYNSKEHVPIFPELKEMSLVWWHQAYIKSRPKAISMRDPSPIGTQTQQYATQGLAVPSFYQTINNYRIQSTKHWALNWINSVEYFSLEMKRMSHRGPTVKGFLRFLLALCIPILGWC